MGRRSPGGSPRPPAAVVLPVVVPLPLAPSVLLVLLSPPLPADSIAADGAALHWGRTGRGSGHSSTVPSSSQVRVRADRAAEVSVLLVPAAPVPLSLLFLLVPLALLGPPAALGSRAPLVEGNRGDALGAEVAQRVVRKPRRGRQGSAGISSVPISVTAVVVPVAVAAVAASHHHFGGVAVGAADFLELLLLLLLLPVLISLHLLPGVVVAGEVSRGEDPVRSSGRPRGEGGRVFCWFQRHRRRQRGRPRPSPTSAPPAVTLLDGEVLLLFRLRW